MTIAAENLTEGRTILVRGRTSYSRLAALIEGEQLTMRVKQARERGSLYPTTEPHTTISLINAQIMLDNPANPSLEEQFVQEKIYTAKSGDNAGKPAFSIDNKGSFLPIILEADPDGPAGSYRQLVLERDLASDLDVTLVLETFASKSGHAKKGVGLRQVILNEPVRYYASGGLDTGALAARGIVVNGPIRNVSAAEAAAARPAGDNSVAGLPANTAVDANGFPVPSMGKPVAQAPVMQAPVAQAPVQYQVPAMVQAPVTQAPVAQAPVQYQAPIAQAPAVAVESPEDQIARLQRQLNEQALANANSGGESAFGAAPALVGAGVGEGGPWAVDAQQPAYQG